MPTLQATFKVHRADPRGVVDGVATEERVVLHPLDPHEEGENDLMSVPQSGGGAIKLSITELNALGRFKPGQLVTVTFDIPD
jgi:hypothetical protein